MQIARQQQADQALGFSPEFSSASPEARKAFIAKEKGGKPPLTLNEQINQVRNRQKEDLEQLLRPHTIMDPISRMMTFHGSVGDEKKQELMDQAQSIITKARSAISNLYKTSGLEIPGDFGTDDVNDFVANTPPENAQNVNGNSNLEKALAKNQKMKWDLKNPDHKKLREEALVMVNGDRDKATEILTRIFVK